MWAKIQDRMMLPESAGKLCARNRGCVRGEEGGAVGVWEERREGQAIFASLQPQSSSLSFPLHHTDKVDADCTSLALSRSATPSSVSPSIKSTGRCNATHTNKIKPDILPLIASGITQVRRLWDAC